MNFQKIVLIVATIFLIGLLGFIAYTLHEKQTNVVYPPVIGSCPDYWVDDKGVCKNAKNLGICSQNKEMNFNSTFWQGKQGLCRKKKWANKCHVTWDGITNNTDTCT